MAPLSDQQVLVSVIMPVHNAEQYVSQAIQSILHETEIPLEVVVVDDRSTDHSLRKIGQLTDPRIRVVQAEKEGIAAALNTGLAAARGRIITRCDADDLYPVQRLRRQVAWLEQHPEAGAVCGDYGAIDPAGQPVIQFQCGDEAENITQELRSGVTRTHLCTYAIRAEALKRTGGFRSYFVTAEDIDLQLRLSEVTSVWFVPEHWYQYRIHDASITHRKSSAERLFFDEIVRDFQKQRLTIGTDALQRGCAPEPPFGTGKSRMSASQHIQSFLIGQAWEELRTGQRQQALLTCLRSIRTLPYSLTVWKTLLSLSLRLMVSPTSTEYGKTYIG